MRVATTSTSPPPSGDAKDALGRLLEHPAIWRGRSAARIPTCPTGFSALDAGLPGGGWPRTGLIEILTPHHGVGELYLLLPALAALTHATPPRWCAWIAPPLEPFAPALAAHGLALERVLVVRTDKPLWALEQALRSGACEAALAWANRARTRDLQRLEVATEGGRTLGVLFRSFRHAHSPSAAGLRLALEPTDSGVRVRLLKSRGGTRAPIDVVWREKRMP